VKAELQDNDELADKVPFKGTTDAKNVVAVKVWFAPESKTTTVCVPGFKFVATEPV
jgi:hypothetical protein